MGRTRAWFPSRLDAIEPRPRYDDELEENHRRQGTRVSGSETSIYISALARDAVGIAHVLQQFCRDRVGMSSHSPETPWGNRHFISFDNRVRNTCLKGNHGALSRLAHSPDLAVKCQLSGPDA